MSASHWSNHFNVSAPVGSANNDFGYVSTTATVQTNNEKCNAAVSATITPYYTPAQSGVDTRFGASISYNFLGGK